MQNNKKCLLLAKFKILKNIMQNNELFGINPSEKGLAVFNFENSPIRTLTNENGETFFVASDVCKVLELSNVAQALTRLDDDEKTDIILNDVAGRPNKAIIINESGLYSLVLSSRKLEAKVFKKWITSEVLPQIRKTGAYSVKPMTQSEIVLYNAQMLVNIERKQLEQQKQITEIKEKQERAEEYLQQISKEPVRTLFVNTRKAVDELVKNYALANNIEISNVYNTLYKDFSLKYRIDLKTASKKRRVSIIGYIEEQGLIAQLFEIAKTIFP